MKTKADLEKYLTPRSPLILFLIGTGITLFFFVLTFDAASLFIGVVFWLVALLQWLGWGSRVHKTLKQLEESGQMKAVLWDFSNARSCAGDKARLGQQYMYGRGRGAVYSYAQVVWMYRFVQRYLFIPLFSCVMVGLKGKKQPFQFCPIGTGKKGKEDLIAIAQETARHNPHILLGYSPENRQAFLQMAAPAKKD